MITFKMFFTVFSKKLLKNILFMICLTLLPIIVFFVSSLSMSEQNTSISAGIYLSEQHELEKQVSKNLLLNAKYKFTVFDSLDDLVKSVESAEVDLGYVFNENFTANLQNGKLSELVTVIKYPNNLYHNFVSEELFSEIFKTATPYIAENFLNGIKLHYPLESIENSINYYKSLENAFEIEVLSADFGSDEQNSGSLQSLYGVICIFVFALAFISNMQVSVSKTLFKTKVSTLRLKIYSVLPFYFFSLVSGLVSLVIINIVLSPTDFSLMFEFFRLFVYQILLLAFFLTLSLFINRDVFCILFPFILILLLITHPIIIDIGAFVPSIEDYLKFLPSYFYLNFVPDFSILISFFSCTLLIAIFRKRI